jgi:hypothetical protein
MESVGDSGKKALAYLDGDRPARAIAADTAAVLDEQR